MRIIKSVYEKIIYQCRNTKYESGGILGGNDCVINTYLYDEGISESRCIGEYFPNTERLNIQICEWQKKNISFYGVFHSHFQNVPRLSQGDIYAVKQIMRYMPTAINKLYFPLVLPMQNKIYSFKAIHSGDETIIAEDQIIII